MKKIFYLTMACLAGLVGCANGQGVQIDSIVSAVKNVGNQTAPTATVPAQSSFKDIMKTEPGASWPRVALTIVALPSTAYKNAIMSGYALDRRLSMNDCMRASAVVWVNTKTSRTIPEEIFCNTQLKGTLPIHTTSQAVGWGNSSELTFKKIGDTGFKRTNGPLPPAKLFPPGIDYSRFYESQGNFQFGVLVRMMGYDLSDYGKDRRLWIVSLPSQPEIESGEKVLH